MLLLVSISDFMAFFKDEHKSIKRGEDHYKKCSYSEGKLTGLVSATMTDKVYPVSVSVAIKLSLSILAKQCCLYRCQQSTRKEPLNQLYNH
jgi:hypothetical protein